MLQTTSSCNEISNSTESDDTLSSVLLSSATCEKLSKSRNLIPTPTVCTVCLRSISLTAAGVIRTHRSVNDRCPESGRPPKLSTTPAWVHTSLYSQSFGHRAATDQQPPQHMKEASFSAAIGLPSLPVALFATGLSNVRSYCESFGQNPQSSQSAVYDEVDFDPGWCSKGQYRRHLGQVISVFNTLHSSATSSS